MDDDVDCLAYMGWQIDQTVRDPREVELEKLEALLATESLVLTEEDEWDFLAQCEQVHGSIEALAASEPVWIKVSVVSVCVCMRARVCVCTSYM